jgi:hypothetical protein
MAPAIPRRTQTVLLAFIGCLAHGQGAFGSRGCPGADDLVDFNGALTAQETQ